MKRCDQKPHFFNLLGLYILKLIENILDI